MNIPAAIENTIVQTVKEDLLRYNATPEITRGSTQLMSAHLNLADRLRPSGTLCPSLDRNHVTVLLASLFRRIATPLADARGRAGLSARDGARLSDDSRLGRAETLILLCVRWRDTPSGIATSRRSWRRGTSPGAGRTQQEDRVLPATEAKRQMDACKLGVNLNFSGKRDERDGDDGSRDQRAKRVDSAKWKASEVPQRSDSEGGNSVARLIKGDYFS